MLPRVIKRLVEQRREVKKLLKSTKDPTRREQLDIRQKAFKLTANSMYGCLGFTNSRFYAMPIAARVTAEGRETLQRTADIATQKLGLEVIYGDTDSIMINTRSTDLAHVKELGAKVKKEVNSLYRALELEIDGIFKSMLLLKKKKYAALVVHEQPDGTVSLERELKGLDLVRRDWCVLSKETGRYVIEQILSGDGADTVVARIHSRLEALAAQVRAGELAPEQYVITKGLNKSPHDYPDAKAQPHLQVALAMMARGKCVNVGDHVPYVICAAASGAGAPADAEGGDDAEDGGVGAGAAGARAATPQSKGGRRPRPTRTRPPRAGVGRRARAPPRRARASASARPRAARPRRSSPTSSGT